MPLCLDASLVPVQSQPATVEACAYVVMSGAEAVAVANSPWNLTVAEGGQIGGAILLVWSVAFAMRLSWMPVRDSE